METRLYEANNRSSSSRETAISTVSSARDDAVTHVSFIRSDFNTSSYQCLIHQHSWIWYHFKMPNIAIPCKHTTPQEMETKHKSEAPTVIARRLLSLNCPEHLLEKSPWLQPRRLSTGSIPLLQEDMREKGCSNAIHGCASHTSMLKTFYFTWKSLGSLKVTADLKATRSLQQNSVLNGGWAPFWLRFKLPL